VAKIVKIRVTNDDFRILKSIAESTQLDAETFAGLMMRRIIDMLASDSNFAPTFFQFGATLEARYRLDAKATSERQPRIALKGG